MLARSVRLYLELARSGYRRYAAYPAATWAGVFTNVVFGLVIGSILLALYSDTRDTVGGYTRQDALTYTWMTQGLLTTVYIWGWSEVSWRIRTGAIVTDLARPVDPLWAALATDLGRAAYHGLYRGLPPVALGVLLFDLTAPAGPLVWAAVAASIMLAVVVSFAFRMLYNLTAFWLTDNRGVMVLSLVTANLLSGFVIPVAFFPGWLETIARLTPFPSMVQVPVDIAVGASDGAGMLGALAIQAGWTAALLALARAILAAGTRRVVIQGG